VIIQNSKFKIQKFRSKFKTFYFLISLLTFTFLLLTCNKVVAQAQPKGVSVSPSIAHIDLATDPAEYILAYTNNFDSDITLSLSAKDFTELEDSYKLEFLSQNQAENYKYSLSSWISFENANLQLNPHETKSVKIFIDKDRITKGGHYASILAEIVQNPNQKDISIKAVISSLLFVRASTGKEIENGKISSLEPLRDNFDYPDKFLLRFQNNGNVHVIPYGLLEIYDPLGSLVAKGILNEDSLDALPESIRSYTIKTNTVEKILLPGFYKVVLNVHYGKINQKVSQSITFFSQGSFDFIKIAAGIILVLIVLLILRKRKKNKK
jgi:hypothetical protein